MRGSGLSCPPRSDKIPATPIAKGAAHSDRSPTPLGTARAHAKNWGVAGLARRADGVPLRMYSKAYEDLPGC